MVTKLNKATLAIGAAFLFTLSACSDNATTPTTTTPTSSTTATISTSSFAEISCSSMLNTEQLALLTAGSTCGYLTVPEKHSINNQPASSRTIKLAVVKFAARSTNKQADPVVYLHGGPGGSAITEEMPEVINSALAEERDVYFVDQRGTGLSEALLCDNYQGLVSQLAECRKTLTDAGKDLTAYTSQQIAHDFIEMRKALAISNWNIYGGSYGTRVATTIIRENSEGIRSVILDGVFPIEINGISENSWAVYENLNQVLRNCQNTTNCDANELKSQIESIVSELQNQNKLAESRAFISMLTGELISDPTMLSRLNTIENNIAQFELPEMSTEGVSWGSALSIVCAEEYPFLERRGMSDTNEQGWSTAVTSAVNEMYHGGPAGFSPSACQAWNVPAADSIETQPVVSNLPVLILNGQQDLQTPAAWGNLVAANMSASQSFTNPQGGHIQLGSNQCFDRLISSFLKAPTSTITENCHSEIAKLTYQIPTGSVTPTEPAATVSKGEDFIDPRDSQIYPTVIIGQQVWMAKNLSFDLAGKSWVYGDNVNNADKYGRLYQWTSVKEAIPAGWHLPTDAEWQILERNLGMAEADLNKSGYEVSRGSNQGTMLQPGGASMMNIQAAGFRSEGQYEGLENRSYFWVDTRANGEEGEEVYRRRVVKGESSIYRFTNPAGDFAISVRLIKD